MGKRARNTKCPAPNPTEVAVQEPRKPHADEAISEKACRARRTALPALHREPPQLLTHRNPEICQPGPLAPASAPHRSKESSSTKSLTGTSKVPAGAADTRTPARGQGAAPRSTRQALGSRPAHMAVSRPAGSEAGVVTGQQPSGDTCCRTRQPGSPAPGLSFSQDSQQSAPHLYCLNLPAL